jgi:hypothetical protein
MKRGGRMNIRPSGLAWWRKNGRANDERVVVSKYFTADESFTHTPVWWFEFLRNMRVKRSF